MLSVESLSLWVGIEATTTAVPTTWIPVVTNSRQKSAGTDKPTVDRCFQYMVERARKRPGETRKCFLKSFEK